MFRAHFGRSGSAPEKSARIRPKYISGGPSMIPPHTALKCPQTLQNPPEPSHTPPYPPIPHVCLFLGVIMSHTLPNPTIPCHTLPHRAIPVPKNPPPNRAIPVPHPTTLCHTVPYPALPLLTLSNPSPVNLLKQLCCDMRRSGVTVDDSIRCFGPFLLLLPLCSAKVGTGKTKHTTFIRNFSTNLFPRCVFLPSYFTINETPPHIVFVALSGPHRWITICTPDLPQIHPNPPKPKCP